MEKTGQDPSAIAQAAEEAKHRMALWQKEVEQARIAVNTAGSNENVRILLRHLMKLSGFDRSPAVIGENKDVLVSSTIYNVGYEALYLDLRKLMSAETKNIVERSE